MANVVIKSYQKGLKIFLDNECSFEDIEEEIKNKFSGSKDFFKNSKIAVTFEGRCLTPAEENILVDAMEKGAEMSIMYVIGKDDETGEIFSKAVEHPVEGDDSKGYFGKLYSGTLKKGDNLETESGIIILGDVEPGASVTAKGSIIVLGGLYGSASVITENADQCCFVTALDISCEQLKIGNINYISKEKAKWVIKPRMQSRIAFVDNGMVKLENTTRETVKELSLKFMEKN